MVLVTDHSNQGAAQGPPDPGYGVGELGNMAPDDVYASPGGELYEYLSGVAADLGLDDPGPDDATDEEEDEEEDEEMAGEDVTGEDVTGEEVAPDGS